MAGLLTEMGAWVKRRRLGQLFVQRLFGFGHVGRHGQVHHRIQIALAALRYRQATFRQAHFLAGPGSRRHLELYRAAERGDFNRRAQGSFPRCQRQVEIQVVSVDAKQRVGAQHDVQVQVVIRPAVAALAALPAQPQALAAGGALGDARFEGALDMMYPALVVVIGHAQVQVHLGAVVGILQADLGSDVVVATRHRPVGPRPAAVLAATREAGEQVGEVDVVERRRAGAAVAEVGAPVRRWPEVLPGLVAAELVIGGALFRVLEGLVGLRNLLETGLAFRIFRHVRVVLVRQLAIGALDVGQRGAAVEP